MLKTEKKTIGEYHYAVTQLDAVKGRRVLARLAKSLGSAGDAHARGVAMLSNEDDIDYLCDVFAANTTVSGAEFGQKAPQLAEIFGLHFAGRYGEMMQWLAFAIHVNFSSFFRGEGTSSPAPTGAASA